MRCDSPPAFDVARTARDPRGRIPPAPNADSRAAKRPCEPVVRRGRSKPGMSIIATKQKNMMPSSVADQRIPIRKIKLSAAAISATPTKYVQKSLPGIHDGTSCIIVIGRRQMLHAKDGDRNSHTNATKWISLVESPRHPELSPVRYECGNQEHNQCAIGSQHLRRSHSDLVIVTRGLARINPQFAYQGPLVTRCASGQRRKAKILGGIHAKPFQ